MSEVKLLTEAEWRKRIDASDHFKELAIAALDNAGLLAPEPVDTATKEAREAVAKVAEYLDRQEFADLVRAGDRDDFSPVAYTIARFRAVELARPASTREMVREAASRNKPMWLSESEVREVADLIHTALTEARDA